MLKEPKELLLPCPFCGSKLSLIFDAPQDNCGGKWGGVFCGCGARGPDVRTGYKPTGWEYSAAAEWNRRVGFDGPYRETDAEIQSNYSRIKFAEGLISQLPENHDGRNTWLLNYGTGDNARELRSKRGIAFIDATQAAETFRRNK